MKLIISKTFTILFLIAAVLSCKEHFSTKDLNNGLLDYKQFRNINQKLVLGFEVKKAAFFQINDNSLGIVLESTSPVGTTQKVQQIIFETRPDLKGELFIAYCPELVLPGNVIYKLEQNDRVIGGIDEAATEKAVWFYKHFVKGELHKTNSQTAEMCKLVENSSRDVQIAFANELSMICDKANIHVWELIRLVNKHPRVNILQPGTGVGGHCIAVDPWFIVFEFPEEAKIIRSARERNNYKAELAIEKAKNAALKFKIDTGKDAVIACKGLAFKPNIDDLRESPALYLTE